MTRVLYVTPGCFDKGGISRYSRYQVTALRELLGPQNVRLLSILGPSADGFEDSFEIDWHADGRRGAAVAAILGHALTWRPDIIHVAHLNYAAVARYAAAISRARAVVNVYGLEVWSSPRPLDVAALDAADLVVSDCHYTARYLGTGRLRQRPVEVIWDCVDTTRFSPAPPRSDVLERYGIPAGDGVNLMTLGRMSLDDRHKGYERLLEVFSQVAQELPELRLIYAGRGDLRKELFENVRSRSLEGRVFFTGSIAEEDLVDVYRAADIFSLVSDRGHGRGEGIPLTPLEASACGAPILVGNHDGSQEAVDDGVNGFVLDPFDLIRHAERIRMLACDGKLRRSMGVAAARKVTRDFAYPHFRRRHAEVLRSLGVGADA